MLFRGKNGKLLDIRRDRFISDVDYYTAIYKHVSGRINTYSDNMTIYDTTSVNNYVHPSLISVLKTALKY
jgi:hypothetical protein